MTIDIRAAADTAAQLREHLYDVQARLDLMQQERQLRSGDEVGDAADDGSRVTDWEQEDLVAEGLTRQLDQLYAALSRVEAGSYGICNRCKQAIGDQRLAAVPAAIHCVRCQELQDRRRR